MNVLDNKDYYQVKGRYTMQEDSLYLAYSASFIEFSFHGTRVSAMLHSDTIDNQNENLMAAVAVFLNGESVPSKRFMLKDGTHEYILYDGEEKDVHLRLMKYSEAPFATFGIENIEVTGKLHPLKKEEKKLIEFIGDSITCGYGDEGVLDRDIFKTSQENPWDAYACMTARMLNADFSLISWSGNGLISQYIDPSEEKARHDAPFMSELYPYADWSLENRMGKTTYTLWKPEKEPDDIVLYLGTNDSSYAREMEERNEEFVVAYKKFLKELRMMHPHSRILCILGTMDLRLVKSAEKAVLEVRKEGIKNVRFKALPFRSEFDGLGTDYHPSKITHKKVATIVATELQKKY